MNESQNSNHDDPLERAVQAYHSQSVPNGLSDELVAEVLAALHDGEKTVGEPEALNIKQRILTMRLSTKIAVAAIVLIALSGLFAWLTPGEGSALAFNNLAAAFATIRTATCELSSEHEGREGASVKSMYMAPSRERSEMSGPNSDSVAITIMDTQKKKAILLSQEMKLATVYEAENMPSDMPGNSFEQLRKQISDAQSGKADEIEQLGQRTIDGRRVVGFRIPKADRETKIWADPDTGLPVQVEFISRVKPKGRSVMSNFRINVDLDESLFSLEVPEGYTVNRVKMDVSKTTVEDLAKTLRVVAGLKNGTFPDELQGVDGITGVMIKAVNAQHGRKDSPEKMKAITELGVKVGRGMNFVIKLAADSDYRYAGKGVKLDTPNRPIFWYKPTKSEKYRVIYADLSIEEVAPADLPKDSKPAKETNE